MFLCQLISALQARLCGATVSALGQYAEGCWFEPQSGYIKCGIFTVHLNSYVVLVVQCLGLGPYPLSPGMVYPRRPYRLWWVLTLNLNRTTRTTTSLWDQYSWQCTSVLFCVVTYQRPCCGIETTGTVRVQDKAISCPQ